MSKQPLQLRRRRYHKPEGPPIHHAGIEWLTERIASTGVTAQDARAAIMATTQVMRDCLLAGHNLRLPGLGVWRWVHYSGRKSGNPLMPDAIPSGYRVKFHLTSKLRKELRDVVPACPPRPRRPSHAKAVNLKAQVGN